MILFDVSKNGPTKCSEKEIPPCWLNGRNKYLMLRPFLHFVHHELLGGRSMTCRDSRGYLDTSLFVSEKHPLVL